MDTKLIVSKVFEKIDFTENKLIPGEFENCTFMNCNFKNIDLSNFIFNDCKFDSCDFSLAILKNTLLNDIKFFNCKLLGLHFEDCNDFVFIVHFENCNLKLSSFYQCKMKNMRFKNCSLEDVDFTETNLTNATFENCDLQNAVFLETNLEKVDFVSSYNYSFDPEKNRIKKAKFSKSGISGLLDKYDIEIE
jgi:fluoroquinolone resistance protein